MFWNTACFIIFRKRGSVQVWSWFSFLRLQAMGKCAKKQTLIRFGSLKRKPPLYFAFSFSCRFSLDMKGLGGWNPVQIQKPWIQHWSCSIQRCLLLRKPWASSYSFAVCIIAVLCVCSVLLWRKPKYCTGMPSWEWSWDGHWKRVLIHTQNWNRALLCCVMPPNWLCLRKLWQSGLKGAKTSQMCIRTWPWGSQIQKHASISVFNLM